MHVLQSKVNHPDLFIKIYEKTKWAPIFFGVFSFFSIFLVINIIVSIFYITYKRHYSKIIYNLGSYKDCTREDYSKLIVVSTNDKGLVNQSNVRRLCKEYLEKGPTLLDYILAKEIQRKYFKTKDDDLLPAGVRDVGCKHQPC